MSYLSIKQIFQELFLRSCYPICDFVLSITTSNVVWWDKNIKTTLQEGVHRKVGCEVHLPFHKWQAEFGEDLRNKQRGRAIYRRLATDRMSYL